MRDDYDGFIKGTSDGVSSGTGNGFGGGIERLIKGPTCAKRTKGG